MLDRRRVPVLWCCTRRNYRVRPQGGISSVAFTVARIPPSQFLRSKVLSKELLADLPAYSAAVFEGMLIVKTSVDPRPKDVLEPVCCIVEGMRVDPVAEG